jgi:hypothetical protein
MIKYGNADTNLKGLTELIRYFTLQISGQDVNKSGVGKGTLYGNIISAQLGGNISIILKQTASLPTIMNEVSFSSFLKALNPFSKASKKGDKNKIADLSGILSNRFTKNEVIKSNILVDSVSKFAKLFGVGMETVDSMVITTVGFRSAQYEAEVLGYGKVGTESNTKQAIKILERIVAKTQSNSMNTEISMARSGYAGLIKKVLSVFSSDLQNKLSYINEIFNEKKYSKRRNSGADILLKESREALEIAKNELQEAETKYDEGDKKLLEAKAKVEELEKEIEIIETSISNNNAIVKDKGRNVRKAKLFTSMALSGLIIVGVEWLVKRLLGRKGWDEDEEDDLISSLLMQSFLFNIPYFQQIYNAIDYNNELSALDMSLINDAIKLATEIGDAVSSGGNYQKLILPFVQVVSDLTGIPLYNLYNLTIGAIKNIDFDSGLKIDMFVRGYSGSYVTGSYESAIKNNSSIRQGQLLDYMFDVYKTGNISDKVNEEINRLYALGYKDVIAKNYSSSITDDSGNTIKLSSSQIVEFRKLYSRANEVVQKMIEINDYKKLSDKEKAIMIKRIFDTYYNYAKAKISNSDLSSRLPQFIDKNGDSNVAKFILYLNKISQIVGDGRKTRKQLVIEYVNSLALSKQEKIELLSLAGFTSTK